MVIGGAYVRGVATQYNSLYDTVISVDVSGMIEYWEPSEPFEKPERVEWTSKAQTGLYEFKKVGNSLSLPILDVHPADS